MHQPVHAQDLQIIPHEAGLSHTYVFAYIYTHKHTQVDRQKPPPLGGFSLLGGLPTKNPEEVDPP